MIKQKKIKDSHSKNNFKNKKIKIAKLLKNIKKGFSENKKRKKEKKRTKRLDKNIRIFFKIGIIIFLIGYIFYINYSFNNKITLLAVSGDKNQYGTTIITNLHMTRGIGKIFINLDSLKEIDTQFSIIYAKKTACDLFNLDCNRYDYNINFESNSEILKGPSAGAGLTLLFVNSIKNKKMPNNFAITGSICPGGIIGNVDGIEEKLNAAIKSGKTKLIIPLFSNFNISKVKTNKNVKIYKVMDIKEAYNIINDINESENENKNNDAYNYKLNELSDISKELCERTSNFKTKINLKKGFENYSSLINVFLKNVSKGNKSFIEVDLIKFINFTNYRGFTNVDINKLKKYNLTNISLLDNFLKNITNSNRDNFTGINESVINKRDYLFIKYYVNNPEEIKKKLSVNPMNLYYDNFYKAYNYSKKLIDNQNYYSAGSFCFNANINGEILLLKKNNLTTTDFKKKYLELMKEFWDYYSKITNKEFIENNVKTFEDFYIYLILTDRLMDVKDNLEKINLSNNLTENNLYYLAYSNERYFTVLLWEKLLKHRGKSLDIDEKNIRYGCNMLIKDLTLKNEYLKRYGLTYDKDIEKILKNLNNPYYSFYLGLELSGKMNTLINTLSINEKTLKNLTSKFLDITSERIMLRKNKGVIPILPIMYYEYAKDLYNYNDISSSFLYANYAMAFNYLDYYLINKQTIAKEFLNVYISNLYNNKVILVSLLFILLFL